jgi:hypothetical protein
MKCEINGMTFFNNDDGRRDYITVAFAEVYYPELKLRLYGVRLTHSDKGWRALPPIAHIRGGKNSAIYWGGGCELAGAACEVMLEMYQKMGGKTPEAAANNAAAKRRIAARKAERKFIPRHELDVPEGASKEEVQAALEAESEARGVECYTEVFERTKPVDAAMPMSEMGLSIDAGVARTLGIAQ